MEFWSYIQENIDGYTNFFLIWLGLLLVFALFQKFLVWRLEYLAKKTKTDLDDAVIRIVNSINPPFYFFVSLFIASRWLDIPEQYDRYFFYLIIVVVTVQVVKATNVFITYLVEKYSHLESGSRTALPTLGKVGKLLTWTIGFLIILQNFGIEVTSLIAGLGIGGVAVALAAQNILGDLFASFSIIFDKPFQTGDFIKVGEHMGEVKKIGIKTTRLQALQGEELIIGNKELTSNKIQNYGKMKKRRVQFDIGVIYETPKQKLKKVNKIIKDAIKSESDAEFDRVNLREFGDSALIYECVYFLKSDDYNLHMNVREKINMAIIDGFEKAGIEFAYPTRVVYSKKDN